MNTFFTRPGFGMVMVASIALGCSGGTAEATRGHEQALDELPGLSARVETDVLHQYDEAPRTPDADDPAIWVNRKQPHKSLVLGTLKDGGFRFTI